METETAKLRADYGDWDDKIEGGTMETWTVKLRAVLWRLGRSKRGQLRGKWYDKHADDAKQKSMTKNRSIKNEITAPRKLQ